MEKRRGRPKKPKRERRSKPLRILMNDDERKAVDAVAAGQGMETSTWARMILLGVAKNENPPAK
jgi:hypothetical protein